MKCLTTQEDTMSDKISELLINRGYKDYNSKRAKLVSLSDNRQADLLLNDFEHYPHAYVIACIMDRQMKAEKAWLIPYKLKKRLGHFEFQYLSSLGEKEIYKAMTEPTPLHRFNKLMSYNIVSAIRQIKKSYKSNAANIWNDTPTSSLLIYRFLEFEGVGPKIATMAANILVRDFKIEVRDKYSIDISVDVQVTKVFKRLGLIREESEKTEEIIYKARSLHPDYPGIFDLSCWEIGREWCRPRKPICNQCFMNELCPKVGVN